MNRPETKLSQVVSEGKIRLDDEHELRVYQLADGTRLIDKDDLEAFFGEDFEWVMKACK